MTQKFEFTLIDMSEAEVLILLCTFSGRQVRKSLFLEVHLKIQSKSVTLALYDSPE